MSGRPGPCFKSRESGEALDVEDREGRIAELCRGAVERLRGELGPTRDVGCLLRYDDVLRHVAHLSRMRLVYEIPEEWVGILWRAVTEERTQVVKDVRSDPDYLTQNEDVRAEIAAPIRVGDRVVGVLNVECANGLDEGDATVVEREAGRLARELAKASVFATKR